MIIRIVQLKFRPDTVDHFLNLFEVKKQQMRNAKGCEHLELWQDEEYPLTFFTYAIWKDESSLNQYRYSEFFKSLWAQTRVLFGDFPVSWNLKSKLVVEKHEQSA